MRMQIEVEIFDFSTVYYRDHLVLRIRAAVMPSVHFNESAILRTDSDSLMKTALNNALIPALNREYLQST